MGTEIIQELTNHVNRFVRLMNWPPTNDHRFTNYTASYVGTENIQEVVIHVNRCSVNELFVNLSKKEIRSKIDHPCKSINS